MCNRMCKQRRWVFVWSGIILWFLFSVSTYGIELEDSLDYEEIQKTLEELLPEETNIDFSDLVDRLTSGDVSGAFKQSVEMFKETLFFEIQSSRLLLAQVIGIVVVSAVFTNFSMAFSKTFIAETGFYLTYMVLFTLLLTSFMSAVDIAVDIMNKMTHFMSVLLPLFCLAIMFTGNLQTGIWYQQAMIAAVSGMEWFLTKIIYALIRFYVLISMVNQLSKEDILSKCGQLVYALIQWSTKTGIACVLGFHFIQGMILPAFDSMKNGWAVRLTSVIPGVGDAMESVIKTMGGSAVLIKNGVGAAGLLVLVLLFLVPAMKLVVLVFFYMIAQAIVQPVADKRMLQCLHSVSEGILLLLKIEGAAAVLFFVSLAMMIAVSGNVYGG